MDSYISTNRAEIWSSLESLRISRRSRGVLISFLRKIEETRGPQGLLLYLKEAFHKLLKIHSTYTREQLVAMYQGSDSHSANPGWKGPMKAIYILSLRRHKGLDRALGLLKMTGLFIAPTPTYKEYREAKFTLNRIVDPFIPLVDEVVDTVFSDQEIPDYIREQSHGIEFDFSMPYPSSDTLCPLSRCGYSRAEFETCPDQHIQSLYMFPNLIVEEFDYFKFLVGSSMPSKESFETQVELKEKEVFEENREDVAGRCVLLTKDRGLKLRLIANGNRMIQLALYPLQRFLKTLLKRVDTCYCFNQDGGVDWATLQFQEGNLLTSLDLKSASDRIPMSTQIHLLNRVLPPHEWKSSIINCFERASRMYWITPKHIKGISIRWRCGTPMGLHGSYYLFTLWLICSFENLGMGKRYAIVGDDIVFQSYFDGVVTELLHKNSIPISVSKSIFSSYTFAEFCGRIVTRYGPLDFTKAKPADADNPVNKMLQLGPRALDKFQIFKRVATSKTTRNWLRISHWIESNRLEDVFKSLSDAGQKRTTLVPGGYTVEQLYASGQVTLAELRALQRVLLLYVKYPDMTIEQLGKHLELPFSYEEQVKPVRLSKSGRPIIEYKVVEKPSIRESLPTMERSPVENSVVALSGLFGILEDVQAVQAGLPNPDPFGGLFGNSEPAKVEESVDPFADLSTSSLSLQQNVQHLYNRYKNGGGPEIENLKPRFNDIGISRNLEYRRFLDSQIEKSGYYQLLPGYIPLEKELIDRSQFSTDARRYQISSILDDPHGINHAGEFTSSRYLKDQTPLHVSVEKGRATSNYLSSFWGYFLLPFMQGLDYSIISSLISSWRSSNLLFWREFNR